MNVPGNPTSTTPSGFTYFRPQPLKRPGGHAAKLDWLWRGFLAPGQVTLLTSLWKSGKTTLLSVLLSRLKEGGELFRLPVRPAKALVISEEDHDLWDMRSERFDLGDHIQLVSRPFPAKPTAAQWESLISHAAELLGTEGGRLLVVDTVATLMPNGVETNADCMTRALAPLRCAAERGLAVWIMHHPHKGKSRAGRWARGTGSLPASVDIVLEMHPWRQEDWGDRKRIILGHARHEETPRRLVIEWLRERSNYRVVAEPDAEDFQRGLALIELILSDYKEPLTAAAILEAWRVDFAPPSRATLHRWLARAVEQHMLGCVQGKGRNAPHRYFLLGDEEDVAAPEA